MDKSLFLKSNKIEKITFIFDILALIFYLVAFFVLFNMLALPEIVNGSMQLDTLQFMLPIYNFMNITFDKYAMNTMIISNKPNFFMRPPYKYWILHYYVFCR